MAKWHLGPIASDNCFAALLYYGSTLLRTYSAGLNSGPKLIREFGKNLERAGIKIGLIELRSCEFRGKLARAGIKIGLIELKGW